MKDLKGQKDKNRSDETMEILSEFEEEEEIE